MKRKMQRGVHSMMALASLACGGCCVCGGPGGGGGPGAGALRPADFERVIGGAPTHLYTLANRNGCRAQFSDYGGRWLSMWVPDGRGIFRDVILGFDTLDGYRNAGEQYHGAITGRVCGRIGAGRFEMDGRQYELANNDLFGKPVKNHLHGGKIGFHKKVWKGRTGKDAAGDEFVEFSCLSPDGEEGYPGDLSVTVRYTLTRENALRIEYRASADRPTIVNLTNHAFFNLSGDPRNTVNEEMAVIHADRYVACDKELVPTGEVLPVKGTPIDFTSPKAVGSALFEKHPEILYGKGYAIAYALNGRPGPGGKLAPAASLWDRKTRIRVDVFSNQPSLQFYNAWLMDGKDIGKQSIPYRAGAGVTLETQGYPDAPNHPGFPSIRVAPGSPYRHIAEYRFGLCQDNGE